MLCLKTKSNFIAQTQSYIGNKIGKVSSKIELSVSCIDLENKHNMSKSDPVCVLYERHKKLTWTGVGLKWTEWTEVGRTEVIKNSLNPNWQAKFVLSSICLRRVMFFRILKFEIYDSDKNSPHLKSHDTLGHIEVSLDTIISSSGQQYTSVLRNSKGGKITIMAEEINTSNQRVTLQLGAQKLDKKDMFGKSDPYFNIHKKMSPGKWSLVYKSETIKNDCNPNWKVLHIPITTLCNNDYERELKIEIFDQDETGEDDLIGEVTTNLSSCASAVKNRTKFDVINPKKKRKKARYKNSGFFIINQCLVK